MAPASNNLLDDLMQSAVPSNNMNGMSSKKLTRMRKRRKFTELRKKYCIRQVFRKKNHVQNLTVIGEEKKVGEK